MVEQGFNLFPDPVSVATGAAGVTTNGDHFIKVVYQWTDNNGQIEYSATSIQDSITIAANESIDVTVATLRLTQKENVVIAVYMTEASGEIFYRATSVTAPDFNPSIQNKAFNLPCHFGKFNRAVLSSRFKIRHLEQHHFMTEREEAKAAEKEARETEEDRAE